MAPGSSQRRGSVTDLILHHAAIMTMDLRAPTAELVAVEKGKITAVTGNRSLKALKAGGARGGGRGGLTFLPWFSRLDRDGVRTVFNQPFLW